MVEIIGVVLILLTVLFVAYPLLQKSRHQVSFAINHQNEDLLARKNEIYTAVRDIDFDYRMGKLSDEDYQTLREQYKQEAVKIMQALDRLGGASGTHTKAASATATNARFCHMCGTPAQRADAFCSACGEKLQ